MGNVWNKYMIREERYDYKYFGKVLEFKFGSIAPF